MLMLVAFLVVTLSCQIGVVSAFKFPDVQDVMSSEFLNRVGNSCVTALTNMSIDSRLRYMDASGRPRSGIHSGNLQWFGSFDDCRSTENARYCLLSLTDQVKELAIEKSPPVRVGLCLPDACDIHDVFKLAELGINVTHRLLPNVRIPIQLSQSSVRCYEEPSVNTGVTCTIVFFSFIAALCLVGTALEVLQESFGIFQEPDSELNASPTLDKGYKVVDKASGEFKSETSPLLGTNKTLSYSNGFLPNKAVEVSDSVELSDKSQNQETAEQELEPVYRKPTPYVSKLVNFFLCFSLLRNSRKVMDTDVKNTNMISSLNGIRVITLFWVILGHIYVVAARSKTVENMANMVHDAQRLSLMIISNGQFCVDTFFVLSGLLLTYNVYKRIKNTDGHINWAWFYLHRFLRLTPTLMVVILFVAKIVRFAIRSPLWWVYRETNEANCIDGWWKNLLYINNFYKMESICITPTWYLAVDMQFFIVTPIIIYLFSRFGPKGAIVTSLTLILGCAITIAVLVSHYDINVMGALWNYATTGDALPLADKVYIRPYCRIQPYIIGLLFGYFMHSRFMQTKRPGWPVALLGWILSFALALVLIYAPYNTAKSDPHVWSTAENICFGMVRHLLWGMVIAWVIYACEYGFGGYVNEFLSASFWLPLSRLNYSAYLVHYHVILVMFIGYRNGLNYTTSVMVYYFCASLVLSYGIAFVLVVTIEYPFANLEMMIFKANKATRNKKN